MLENSGLKVVEGSTAGETDPESRCLVEVWDPTQDENQIFNDLHQISAIDLSVFGPDYGWNYDTAQKYIVDFPRSCTVVLRDPHTKEIIGYTTAVPTTHVYRSRTYRNRRAAQNVAYIANTAIKSEYRGRHLTQEMMELLEKKLRDMGFDFVDRDAADESIDGQPSYADKVIKNNADRIEFETSWNTPLGKQRYIRMSIEERAAH